MGPQEEKLREQIANLKNQLNRKVNEMHSMQQIGKTLSSVLDRDRLLILIMDEVTSLMNAERGTLYIVDEEQGELWSKIAQKAEIKATLLSEDFDLEKYQQANDKNIILLFAIDPQERLRAFTDQFTPDVQPGWTLLTLVPGSAE